MSPTRARFCICGRSQAFPWCDGSHRDEGWRCGVTQAPTALGFSASFRLENLAFKLASEHQGVILSSDNASQLHLHRWVLLLEGTEWEELQRLSRQVQAEQVEILTLGTPAALLQPFFPNASIHELQTTDLLNAFELADTFVRDPNSLDKVTDVMPLPSVFLSHAVKDEPFLLPLLRRLRERFALQVFVCADSIRGGRRWQEEIEGAMRKQDCVVGILSKDALQSHFCSFELGMAAALNKPIYLLSLDGSMPHVFAQHLQTIDLPRLQKSQPWMDKEDLFLQQYLRCLTEDRRKTF